MLKERVDTSYAHNDGKEKNSNEIPVLTREHSESSQQRDLTISQQDKHSASTQRAENCLPKLLVSTEDAKKREQTSEKQGSRADRTETDKDVRDAIIKHDGIALSEIFDKMSDSEFQIAASKQARDINGARPNKPLWLGVDADNNATILHVTSTGPLTLYTRHLDSSSNEVPQKLNPDLRDQHAKAKFIKELLQLPSFAELEKNGKSLATELSRLPENALKMYAATILRDGISMRSIVAEMNSSQTAEALRQVQSFIQKHHDAYLGIGISKAADNSKTLSVALPLPTFVLPFYTGKYSAD